MTHALTRTPVRTALEIALGIGVALAAGLALPLLIHLIPVEAGPPAGARLLPIFVALIIAAMRMGLIPVLAIAVAQPFLNQLLTGRPEGAMAYTLAAELLITAGVLLAARRWAPRALPFVAAPAYLLAAAIVNLLVSGQGPLATWSFAVAFQLPGLALLALTGLLASRGRPSGAPPDRHGEGAS
ncbi:MAG: hypothetical protein WD336_00825 [Trueperaceae bacterium]